MNERNVSSRSPPYLTFESQFCPSFSVTVTTPINSFIPGLSDSQRRCSTLNLEGWLGFMESSTQAGKLLVGFLGMGGSQKSKWGLSRSISSSSASGTITTTSAWGGYTAELLFGQHPYSY